MRDTEEVKEKFREGIKSFFLKLEAEGIADVMER
jgi:hypothetical protein